VVIYNSVQGDDKTTHTRVLEFFLHRHCAYLYFKRLYSGHIYPIHSDYNETTNYLCFENRIRFNLNRSCDYLNGDWFVSLNILSYLRYLFSAIRATLILLIHYLCISTICMYIIF